jgi:hypothetical protein
MLQTCERCKKQFPKAERCNYCNKLICESCTKSSKRASKVRKLFICKDCWSNMASRTKFKSA